MTLFTKETNVTGSYFQKIKWHHYFPIKKPQKQWTRMYHMQPSKKTLLIFYIIWFWFSYIYFFHLFPRCRSICLLHVAMALKIVHALSTCVQAFTKVGFLLHFYYGMLVFCVSVRYIFAWYSLLFAAPVDEKWRLFLTVWKAFAKKRKDGKLSERRFSQWKSDFR